MNRTVITKPFSAEKLHRNILLTAINCKIPAGQAEEIADLVLRDVTAWLKDRDNATTNDIRRVATKTLAKLQPKVAEYYKTANRII